MDKAMSNCWWKHDISLYGKLRELAPLLNDTLVKKYCRQSNFLAVKSKGSDTSEDLRIKRLDWCVGNGEKLSDGGCIQDIDHLFIQCNFARELGLHTSEVSFRNLKKLILKLVIDPTVDANSYCYRLIVASLWSIWLQINNVIFENKRADPLQALWLVKD
ncbi:hypothetical protein Gohar_020015 [Gossypium harknessii]|uniref:Uncharacterized protein n=1 Tax=Gossypium harknessii TaxID=34285 RepID=A0A7J9HWG8_9ROSI|nr:hypothetical protein [Gossypium harknessii]